MGARQLSISHDSKMRDFSSDSFTPTSNNKQAHVFPAPVVLQATISNQLPHNM